VVASLDGRTCLVTGASRGIGRSIALELGDHGADVGVNYRSSGEEANDVVGEIETAGGTAVAVQADVAEHDQVAAMRERIHDAFGPVDVLVNNAGITVDRTLENMTREDWDRVIDVNLGGTFDCTNCTGTSWTPSTAGRSTSRASSGRTTTRRRKAACSGSPAPSP